MREWFVRDGSIKSYSGSETVVEIPREIYGHEIEEIGDFSFSPNNSKLKPETIQNRCRITKVTVPEGVKRIGAGAFMGCSSLSEVCLPDSLESIGCNAFQDCISIREIHLPKTVSIDGAAFSGCISLVSFEFPQVIKVSYSHTKNWYTPSDCFSFCRSLKDVCIPHGVIEIKHGTFFKCTSLRTIKIPETVKYIDDCAFMSCESLEEITIPDYVCDIKSSLFGECYNLHTVNLSRNVKEIHSWAFRNCTSLKGIELPKSLEKIGHEAFQNSGLIEIIIPERVEELGFTTFIDCQSLRKVTILGKDTGVYELGKYVYQRHPFCEDFPNIRDICIAGYSGSMAETFAREHGMPFESL